MKNVHLLKQGEEVKDVKKVKKRRKRVYRYLYIPPRKEGGKQGE